MAFANQFVNPTEVFAAIEYAKIKNEADIYGDNAFKVDLANARTSKDKSTRYRTYSILKKNTDNDWVYIPLKLRFVNLHTRARIVMNIDGGKGFDGARLQFARSSSSIQGSIVQPYGEAKHVIMEAFGRLCTKYIASKELRSNPATITSNIQYERSIKNQSGETISTEKLADAIIRVNIPFITERIGNARVIKPTDLPDCKIYDLTKPIMKAGKPVSAWQEATTEDGAPITYSTINAFIKPGSVCSGIDDMSSLVCSKQGISLTSKVNLLMVKPSKGFAPEISDVFSMSDMAEMADAITEEVADESTKGKQPAVSKEALGVDNDLYDEDLE